MDCCGEGKCHILTVLASAHPLSKLYKIDGIFLQHFDRATYLGTITHHTLTFSVHITEAASKANKKFGVLKQNRKGCPFELKKTIISLTHSGLEYGAPSGIPTWKPRRRLSKSPEPSYQEVPRSLPTSTVQDHTTADPGRAASIAKPNFFFIIAHRVAVVTPENLSLVAAELPNSLVSSAQVQRKEGSYQPPDVFPCISYMWKFSNF